AGRAPPRGAPPRSRPAAGHRPGAAAGPRWPATGCGRNRSGRAGTWARPRGRAARAGCRRRPRAPPPRSCRCRTWQGGYRAVTTFSSVLRGLLGADAGRPLITFYDHAGGERVELSVTTYANWVAKV